MSLSFEWVRDGRQLDELRDIWASLDDGSAPGGVFRSWEWQATWWRLVGEEPAQKRELRLLVGRDPAGRVRGLLPLYLEDAPVAGLWGRRRLGLLADGTVGSDYLGLVAPESEQAELAPLFARQLAADPDIRAADLIELNDLLAGDALDEALPGALAAAGWEAIERAPRYSCYVALLDDDLEAYLASRPNGLAGQLRQRRRALSKKKGFRIEHAGSPAELARGLPLLFALHKARWQEEGGSSAFTSERIHAFHLEAGRLMCERGWARLALVSIEGEPVAAGYGFARAGRFVYYQAGMLPAWRKQSAGTVLLGELLERAHGEGLRELDFLRGDEPYKALWGNLVRPTVGVRARPATLRARLFDGAQRAYRTARVAAGRVTPAAARRLLRRLGMT